MKKTDIFKRQWDTQSLSAFQLRLLLSVPHIYSHSSTSFIRIHDPNMSQATCYLQQIRFKRWSPYSTALFSVLCISACSRPDHTALLAGPLEPVSVAQTFHSADSPIPRLRINPPSVCITFSPNSQQRDSYLLLFCLLTLRTGEFSPILMLLSLSMSLSLSHTHSLCLSFSLSLCLALTLLLLILLSLRQGGGLPLSTTK